MRSFCLISTIALATLASGCSPIVVTNSKTSEFKIYGECERKGKDTFVKVRVVSADGHSNWKAEFEGATPEDLSENLYIAVTDIRWKIGQEHIKPLGVTHYEIKLTSGEKVFKATVGFRTTSEQIIGAFIQSIIRIH